MQERIGKILTGHLFEIGATQVTLGALISVLMVLVVAYLVALVIKKVIIRALTRSGLKTQSSASVPARLAFYLILTIGAVIGLQLIGIDLSAIFAAGAIFTVGLGFAMQNIVQNFVAGIILMVEQSIKPDDVLEVQGEIVRVGELRVRSTVARTREHEELIIPNSILVQGVVKNYTMSDSLYMLSTVVGVSYSSEMNQVQTALLGVAQQLDWRDKTQEPRVLMSQFGSSSVEFTVFVWTSDPWNARRQQSELNERIWWALKEQGITIAFPQLDVHFDTNVAPAPPASGSDARTL